MAEINVRSKRINWVPYALLLPSLIYLVLFFAWPMTQGLILSVRDGRGLLALNSEPTRESPVTDRIPTTAFVEILELQGNVLEPGVEIQGNLLTERWFYISAQDPDGNPVEGWTSESRIRVRESAADGTPIMGTVRTRLGADVDPLTNVYAEPTNRSPVVGQVEPSVMVDITGQQLLEVWYRVRAEDPDNPVEGWAPSRYIQVFGETDRGRVDRGNVAQYTTRFLQRMVNDRFFWPALGTTMLLMVLIIPVQFALAIVMALVIQARLKGNSFFLYVFAIPLGVSELAVGILWFSIFTQNGLLNSVLQGLGLIDAPITYLTANTRYWIIIAIWLAEVWRATSLVMVIVVSGLQAISDEVLEAAELFGANLWQRIRYVILPMLRPSLQVALILRTILALQVFAVVIALSGGDVVTVLANETYRQYVTFRNSNVAAAYAALILLISMVSAVVYLRTIRSQEEAGVS
jgi:multiple sugar transport system permease protein